MDKKIVFIVALEDELPQAELPNLNIKYSGVGKINATYKTSEIIKNEYPDLIINYGTAGSLRKDLNGLHEVSKFLQRDMDATPLGFKIGETPFDSVSEIDFGRRGLSCSTGDSFVTTPPLLMSDLVDMEAYAIAKVCWLSGVDFMCFKYISDDADNEAPNNWEKNIWSGKEAFKAFISDPDFQEYIFAKERK